MFRDFVNFRVYETFYNEGKPNGQFYFEDGWFYSTDLELGWKYHVRYICRRDWYFPVAGSPK